MCILDDKGIFTAVNQHWVEKAGYTKEEAERKMHFSQLIHPDDAGKVRTYFAARACPGKSAPAHYEVRVVGKSGNIMDTVINTRMLPESKLRVVSILDITDLKESEDRYKALVELGVESGECILALQDIDNQEGIITFVSENFLHRIQYTQKEVIGKPFFSFLAEADRPEALSRHRGKMKGEELTGLYEMSVVCKNGRSFPVELTSTITQYEGKPANVVYLRDISEKKLNAMKLLEAKAQSKALQKSKQLMAEFQAMVSHEIRTPLAAIKGFASSLLQPDVKWSKNEMLDFVREIDAGADRLACIVNDLLKIASLNGSEKKYEKTCQLISQIFEKAERSLQEIAGNRKLVISPAPGLPRVLANPEQIIQVLCNLVDNASKFSPEGSEITIKAVQNGRSATISVTDEGTGISKEEQAKIFDRLYQVKQITYGAKEGTGLGLAICKRIIDQHNGKIWLDSNPGKGSTFYFILPICKD